MAPEAGLIRILVVAAPRLYRDGLAQGLGGIKGFRVVRIAADLAAAYAAVSELRPDVLVLDMNMPGSDVALPSFPTFSPETRVVALGVSGVESEILSCVEAGVAGYVSLEGSLDDVESAIRSAVRGEFPLSARMAGLLARRIASLVRSQGATGAGAALTHREVEVVRLVGEGLSNKEIARRLGVEVATVKNHVHNLMEKLRVRSRSEAAAWAARHPGLLRKSDRGIPA